MGWENVYRLVRRIPKGCVATYGDIARASRIRGGARAVGHAMAATPQGQSIPWHRVVGANGRLLIREPYNSLQRKLLESEGVAIVNGRARIESCRWSAGGKKSARKNRSKKTAKPARKKS